MEVRVSPFRLEFHEGYKPVIVLPLSQFFLRVVKLGQFIERKINPAPIGQVRTYIPDNIGELQRQAQVIGVIPAACIFIAKDLDTDQTDSAGHPITIFRELRKTRESDLLEIHLHAIKNVFKVQYFERVFPTKLLLTPIGAMPTAVDDRLPFVCPNAFDEANPRTARMTIPSWIIFVI